MLARIDVRQVVYWLILTVGLVGCTGTSPVIKVSGKIEASADLNPDVGGRASPTVVRVYQLRSSGSFQRADFFALYDNETSSLGQSLIASEEFELQPGESRVYNTEIDVAAKYIGVVAAFRDLENAHWRELLELPVQKKIPVYINLERLKLSLSVEKN